MWKSPSHFFSCLKLRHVCKFPIFLSSEFLSSMPTYWKILFSQKGLKCIVWLFSWLYLCHGISFHNIDSGEGALRKPLRPRLLLPRVRAMSWGRNFDGRSVVVAFLRHLTHWPCDLTPRTSHGIHVTMKGWGWYGLEVSGLYFNSLLLLRLSTVEVVQSSNRNKRPLEQMNIYVVCRTAYSLVGWKEKENCCKVDLQTRYTVCLLLSAAN